MRKNGAHDAAANAGGAIEIQINSEPGEEAQKQPNGQKERKELSASTKDGLGDFENENHSFASYFRDASLIADTPLAWAIGRRLDVLDALRALFSGPRALVQLRLWCFMELASLPQARVSREDLGQLFHALVPSALENTLKRLRDANLLVWDAASQDYQLSALAQQVHGLLAPLTRMADADDDELAPLLAQIAGAQTLGLADAGQLRHLHAQLARLHDSFAEAIASGSEALLRDAQPRFARSLDLVARAGEALTALIRAETEDPRLEREARALGNAQARLLAMASQFTRAMQQADRQRVTLGSSGLTSSDVREWLQNQPQLHALLAGALSTGVAPVFLSPHDLMDVAEGELERDRPDPERTSGLPPPTVAGDGTLQVLRMPEELGALIHQLDQWQPAEGPRPLDVAVLGGRFAQAAYRLQLLPLLGDAQARTLKGQTGQLARSAWSAILETEVVPVNDPQVLAMSRGRLESNELKADDNK